MLQLAGLVSSNPEGSCSLYQCLAATGSHLLNQPGGAENHGTHTLLDASGRARAQNLLEGLDSELFMGRHKRAAKTIPCRLD